MSSFPFNVTFGKEKQTETSAGSVQQVSDPKNQYQEGDTDVLPTQYMSVIIKASKATDLC